MAKARSIAKILKREAYKNLSGSGDVSADRIRLYLQNSEHIKEAIEKFKMKQKMRELAVSVKKEKRKIRENPFEQLQAAERPKKKLRLSQKIAKGSKTLDSL